MLAEECKLQLLFHEMNGKKNGAAFCAFHGIQLPDRGVRVVCHVFLKAWEIPSDTAGFIHFEPAGNIFSRTHTNSARHVNVSGSKESAVDVSIQGSFGLHKFVSMVYGDVMQGLSFFEER